MDVEEVEQSEAETSGGRLGNAGLWILLGSWVQGFLVGYCQTVFEICLHRAPNVDCYRVGAVPKV